MVAVVASLPALHLSNPRHSICSSRFLCLRSRCSGYLPPFLPFARSGVSAIEGGGVALCLPRVRERPLKARACTYTCVYVCADSWVVEEDLRDREG